MTVAVGQHSARAEQLKQLRRQMAAVSGKVGAGRQAGSHSHPALAEALLPDSEVKLPVPPSLADALPGALPRGTVAVLSGARSLPLSMVAAVTAAGHNAAIVGQPDVGSAGRGGDGCGPEPAGCDTGPRDRSGRGGRGAHGRNGSCAAGPGWAVVPPSRARAVVARAHQKGCTLLVVDGDWQGARSAAKGPGGWL